MHCLGHMDSTEVILANSHLRLGCGSLGEALAIQIV